MSLETKLHVEIEDEFDALAGMEKGTEAYRSTVDGVTKLLDRAIELEKLDIEEKYKETTMREERRDRLVKNCMTAAGIVLPLAVTIWGTVKSIEFEKEGTITTIMGRGFFNKLLPKK